MSIDQARQLGSFGFLAGAVDAWLLVRAARLSLDHAGEGAEGAELAGLVY